MLGQRQTDKHTENSNQYNPANAANTATSMNKEQYIQTIW